MKGKNIRQKIQAGEIRRSEVIRRLGEMAFGSANDCVKLVLEENPDLDRLNLILLSEVKKTGKGDVEVKLIDRLLVLEKLQALVEAQEDGLDSFLQPYGEGEAG